MEEWGLGWPVLQRGQSRPGDAARLRLRPDRALPPPPRLRAHRARHRRALLPRRLSRRDAGGARHRAARRLHLQPLRRDRRDAGAAPQGGDRPRPGDRRRHLRGGVPADGRAGRRLRPVRQGARARGLGQLRRRPARPLPHQGRQVGGDRLHHRQDVRAPVGGDGAPGAGLAPALRRAAQAARGARRGQRHRHRVGRLAHPRRGDAALHRRGGAGRQAQLDRRHLRGRALPGPRQPRRDRGGGPRHGGGAGRRADACRRRRAGSPTSGRRSATPPTR